VQIIESDGAPKAIGPYSQAVRTSGSLVFLSGQIPLDPTTGQLIQGDIRAQTSRVMESLGALLGAVGLSFAAVAKTTIYLVDLADSVSVNEVYGRHFPKAPPARAMVQVAALPKGARVEIDAIAVSQE
jgi:2-iminobutanoate/2-iminopropanoate deaminase